MSKVHPNINILKRFNPSNLNALDEVMADDFVWHYINPELAELEGDYFGLNGLKDFFLKISGRTENSFQVNPLSIIPLGDELLVTHVVDKMLLEGNQMTIEAVVLWCIVDGKIKEAWDIPIKHTAKFL